MDMMEYIPPIIEKAPFSMQAVFDTIGDEIGKVDQEFRKNLGSGVPIITDIGRHDCHRNPVTAQFLPDFLQG